MILKNAACSVAYGFYQLQRKQFTPGSQDPTCTRGQRAFRSWWFALWVEWQHQKLHTHTHTRSLLSRVPKELNQIHSGAYNSPYAARTCCRPPGRKRSGSNEKPHLHLRWLSALFVSRSPPPMERQEKESSSVLCQVWRWRVFLNFGTVLFAPGSEMWPPKQGW